MTKNTKCGVIILAAGLGKRMHSAQPKVLHEIAGKPFLFHLLFHLQRSFGPKSDISIGIVVGHRREDVEHFVKSETRFANMNIQFVIQNEQLGTGHAAQCAMRSDWGKKLIQARAEIFIFPGDLPLITTELIQAMVQPLPKACGLRLLTCFLDDPTGYGRVTRKGPKGLIQTITEEKDADSRTKLIKEVATSIYLFPAELLAAGLDQLSNRNAQGEYYLTDLVKFVVRKKKKIESLVWADANDLRGVNNLWELTDAESLMNQRLLKYWALKGVKFINSATISLDLTVELSAGVVVHPGAIIKGNTRIGNGSIIGPQVVLKDVEIGKEVWVKTGTVAESSRIDDFSQIGPYAHLRPESRVGSHVKIGNFVELKKAVIGDHTNVAHLSYLGDAQVGERVNIGCGFITCNFDGRVIDGERKHKTVIEDDVFMGSDCQVIAPITIGKGSYVASGSTITADVEQGALAIGRSRQVTKKGYARKLRSNLFNV